jgi:SynChlorMet cassette radical SAM/SPASM protein ScmE
MPHAMKPERSDMRVMPTPRNVEIAITGKCNLTCSYCFFADEMVGRSDLPIDRWQVFFDELGRLKVMTVCLTGGEVFTRQDLFELIDGLTANHLRYQILTNGTLITEKILSQFEIGKRRQRLNSIQVSIDGSQANVHDKSRPNSFSKAVRGLKLLLDAKYPVTVRVTVNRHNVDNLEDIAHFLLEEVGLPSFSTNDAFPCGATNRSEQDITLNLAQKQKAAKILMDLSERYLGRINASAGPLAVGREFEKIKAVLAKGGTNLPGRGRLNSCNGVFSKLDILHDGTIVPCHNLSTLHLGIIGIDDIQKIWLEHPTLLALRQRQQIPLNTLDTCQDCQYIGFCSGGCPGGAMFHYGKQNARNPFDCLRVLMGQDPFFKLPDLINKSIIKNGRSEKNDRY